MNILSYFFLFILFMQQDNTVSLQQQMESHPVVASIPVPSFQKDSTIRLADPTIFYSKGKYYLYGTGGDVSKGFLVYTSSDLENWTGPAGNNDGYALVKGETFGTGGFWAPQVIERKGIFYMAYTANEQIAIAQSDSPLGPFTQKEIKKLSGPGKQIDPFVFFDKHGTPYLFHVRLDRGNRIYSVKMKDDLSDIIPGTEKECIAAPAHQQQGHISSWENTSNAGWPVAEGPTVISHDDKYFLFYSANDFRNKNYAVGYATSDNINGPWKRHEGNPIINPGNMGVNGTGHGDLFNDKSGNTYYVFHTHFNQEQVQPRLTAIVKLTFKNGLVLVDSDSFRYLELVK